MTTLADTPLLPGLDGITPQAVFELDSGDLVAVAISTSQTAAATLAFAGYAWLVDADGDMQAVDSAPIATRMTHAAPAQQVAAIGVQAIADAIRDLLLGESAQDPPVIAWGHDFREQISIRNVITIARAAGVPIDWSNHA